VLVAVAVCVLTFAAIAASATFLSASGPGERPAQRGSTLAELGEAGGVTEAFATGVSFIGILVLVLFIANFGGEISQGTFRTLLMREPRRVALLAGKMLALLAFVAGALLLAELATVAASALIAPSQDVSTSAWFSLDGLGAVAADYGTALAGVAAWASLGMAVAIFVRSVPIGLAIGIVWSGPFEHSIGRALALVGVYVALAVAAASAVFARRDVTG
jgi:hypothetical protein